MRPVRLDLDGFAAFREPATIDFTEADYFALVGPTGSGKSTVIDAMTFALYGSAPRWGSSTSIQYALAPTANRCTVRLIFDVNGSRYAIAREVRRGGQQVSQKSCLLERYVDPLATGDPEADEDTESLAADPRSVRQAVAELLGLDFEDFCTCVVLPQGEFATFLQASPTERQNILLKLIGARIYDSIGKVAGQRATTAAIRAKTLTDQLAELADATEENERAKQIREHELERAQGEVEAQVAAVRARVATRTGAAAALATGDAEIALLSAVTAPADIVSLQADIAAADAGYQVAAGHERDAATAAAAADRAVANGPRRALVEETLRWHADVAESTTRLVNVRVDEQRAEQVLAAATLQLATAAEAADRARAAHRATEEARTAAADRTETVRSRLTELRAVELPADLAATVSGLTAAAADRDAARDRVSDAEQAVSQARATRESLPDQGTRERTRRTVTAYVRTSESVAELEPATARLNAETDAAHVTLAARTAERTAAHEAWEQARTTSVVADLRPRLEVGQACPVCEQALTTLPPPAAAPDLVAAAAHRDAAVAAETLAQQAWRRLADDAQQTADRLDRAREQSRELDSELVVLLPGRPAGENRDAAGDQADIDGLERSATAAADAEVAAGREVTDAREAARTAEDAHARLSEQARGSWGRLNAATGRLAQLGAPAVTATDLGAAWHALHDWAGSEANRISLGALPELENALAAADAAARQADDKLAAALGAERTAHGDENTATAAHHGARLERDQLERRLGDLQRRLADRPTNAGALAQKIECELLESAAAQARTALTGAADRRTAADRERQRLAGVRDIARQELHRTRDPLVRLGAPAVDDRDLARSWADLGSWAAREVRTRQATIDRLRSEFTAAGDGLTAALDDLRGTLSGQGIEVPELGADDPDLATAIGAASTAVRVERERARAATAEVVERRRSAAKLQTSIAANTESHLVAAELQRLMRSQKFPQWLANAALDTLVADASDSLLRLSNGQFELTHERGEFFVVDHSDADSRRSVRTLSGGETFQASLALALALSEQLATLAAGGRTTLDSIFLDEGFGTLDPEALEVVAVTLENLAQEDRMVGVVTHVSALAERIPVRFEVTRDSRTSSIQRTGA